MSSLLEQAIVDATALKEAATKTAEKNLVEKYSNKIKEAVDKLLEQDLNIEQEPVDQGMQDQSIDPSGAMDNTPSDLAQPEVKEDPLSKIKPSYLKNKSDDELITIDFSSLKPVGGNMQAGGSMLPMTSVQPMNAMPTAMPATPPAAPAAAPLAEGLQQYEFDEADLMAETDAMNSSGLGETDTNLPMEEEVEVQVGEMEEDYRGEGPETTENLGGTFYEEQHQCDECGDYPEHGGTVEIHLGEEEQEEGVNLEEELKVDMVPESDGWRGMQPNEKRELQNVALAQAQDEEYQRKLAEYEEALEASQERIKKTSTKNKSLVKENEDLKETLMSLKEHIEGMNLSNAKLLYMNRILGNPSFNERQKSQIVESISRTDTVEAAKIAFETLQSAVGASKTEVKAPKSLNEAVSRSSSPFLVKPRKLDGDPSAERMKILAGITKK